MSQFIESLESRTLLTVTLDSIADQSHPAGKAIFVPVTASTSGSTAVSYQVSSSNSQVTAQVLTNVTFLKMDISIGGTAVGSMEFALFGSIAPNTVARITQLVSSGFYNGLTFHRVISGFMAQGGDPTGNGTGGSGTDINDEFNANAIFDQPYLLAMANSNRWVTTNSSTGAGYPVNDTGDSQFFVTVEQTRWLDFRHTIFGQLLSGQNVLSQIMAQPVDSNDKPTTSVVITSASIVPDLGDAVIMVNGPANAPSVITVKATDINSTVTKTFNATVYADTTDDPPFLNAIANQTTTPNTSVQFAVSVTDIDSSTITSPQAISFDSSKLAVAVSGNTITVTPVGSFTGTGEVLVAVYQGTSGNWDSQVVNVTVQPLAYDATSHALTITGTTGNDTVALSVSSGTLTVNFNGASTNYTLANISSITANLGGGNDTFSAGSGVMAVSVNGGAGNDTITGGDGNDTLVGGAGDDNIYGGLGADSISGGIGNDYLSGGAGPDTIDGGAGGDIIMGANGFDSLLGGAGNDTIYGGSGNDRMFGGTGTDVLFGNSGSDYIDVGVSSVEHDAVYAGLGYDTVKADADDIVVAAEVLSVRIAPSFVALPTQTISLSRRKC